MTNNTDTLNGALQELGETMARNLSTMGVTSTYDEGLSTLASKILTIHLETSLSSDTNVLSYADSSSAVLTTTVLEAGSALTGETVKFYKYVDGTNDVLLGSDVTDSNGEATYTYASAGIGDLEVYAKVRGLKSESCSIEDCTYWNSAEVTRTTTQGSTIYDDNLSQTLPTNCEISFDVWSNVSLTNGQHRFFLLPKSQYMGRTTQPADALYVDYVGGANRIDLGKRESGSTIGFDSPSNVTMSEYHTVKFVKTGTSVEIYVDGTLKTTQTVLWIDNYSDYCFIMMRWSASGTSKIKNVKFKPL